MSSQGGSSSRRAGNASVSSVRSRQNSAASSVAPSPPVPSMPNGERERSASASTSGGGGREGREGQSSHMESSVTRLLVATKQLLESLTRWSQGKITENDVSDIYVRLGNEFNVACRAFSREGIGMSELLSVPEQLRTCLEDCLSEEASPQTLEQHLPKIREIIIGLLQGLKSKQQAFRSIAADRRSTRDSRDQRESTPTNDPNSSVSSLTTTTPSSGVGISLSDPSVAAGDRPPASGLDRTSRGHMYSRSLNGPRPRISDSDRTVSGSGGSGEGRSAPGSPMSDGGGLQTSQSTKEIRRPSGLPDGPRLRRPDRRLGGSIDESGSPRNDSDNVSLPGSSSGGGRVSMSLSSSNIPATSLNKSRSSTSLRDRSSGGPGFLSGGSGSRSASGTSDPGDRGATGTPPPPVPSLPREPPTRSGTMDQKDPSFSPPTSTITTDSSEAPSTPPLPAIPPASPMFPNGPPVAPPAPPIPEIRTPDRNLRALPPEPSSQAQKDSLAALQKSETLMRRASKRFSAYTFNKMAGSPSKDPGSSLGSTMLGLEGPSTPDGNAGRELVNGTKDVSRRRSRLGGDLSERRRGRGLGSAGGESSRPPLPDSPAQALEKLQGGGGLSPNRSPRMEPAILEEDEEAGDDSATATAPPSAFTTPPRRSRQGMIGMGIDQEGVIAPPVPIASSKKFELGSPGMGQENEELPESWPITVFLQLGREVKKTKLEAPPTVASLRVLFTERFGYSSGLENFPTIYVRDAQVGVQYELEDMAEVKDRCVLSLNIEPLDQVKQHIDQGLATLAQDLKDLKISLSSINRQSTSNLASFLPSSPGAGEIAAGHARPTERQFQAVAQRVLRLKKESLTSNRDNVSDPSTLEHKNDADPPKPSNSTVTPPPGTTAGFTKIVSDLKSNFDEVQNVRREIGVIRQVYDDFTEETKQIFSSMRERTEQFRRLSSTKVGNSRAYIDAGKGKLDLRTQELLTTIEDLQDTVEDLKSDVTSRKIRPKPNQMSQVKKRIDSTVQELESIEGFIGTVKPTWKQTWATELQNIVEEQQMLNHQEELLRDLREDHKDISAVFENIEQYLNLRSTSGGGGGGGGPGVGKKLGGTSFVPPPPREGHEGLKTVMREVIGINSDPTRRLKALQQAEKARAQTMAANQGGEFANELGDFVSAKMLRKTGGTDEVERLRQKKSAAALKSMFSAGGGPNQDGGESSNNNSPSIEGGNNQPNGDTEGETNEPAANG